MRKNNREIKDAFLAGEAKSKGSLSTVGRSVWYHGYRIIVRYKHKVYGTLASFNTVSTREKLREIGDIPVYITKGVLNIAGVPIETHKWYDQTGNNSFYDGFLE